MIESQTDALAGAISASFDRLAVEIRRSDLAVVGRTTLGDLPEWLSARGDNLHGARGGCFAVLTLGNGETLAEQVTADRTGEALRDELRAAAIEALADPHERGEGIAALAVPHEAGHATLAWVGPQHDTAGGIDADLAVHPAEISAGQTRDSRFKLLYFRGTPLRPDSLRREGPASEERPGRATAVVRAGDRQLLVQVLRVGEVARNVVVPPGASLRVEAPGGRPTRFTIGLGHHYADRIGALRMQFRLDELVDAIGALPGDDLAGLAKERPAAALLFCYALLRNGEGALRERAFDAVRDALPDLADTQILLAERDARDGRTADAIKGFLHAEKLGLPSFSFGLGYLCDRMRFFVRAAEQGFRPRKGVEQLPKDAVAALRGSSRRLQAAIARVQRFAMAADFSAPLTVYVGVDPSNPSSGLTTREQFEAADANAIGPA